MKKTNYYVSRRKDGRWNYTKEHANRPTGIVDTQGEATQNSKRIVGNQGGGEVRIKGLDGKFRDSDTVKPAKDPNPPKDTKF